jgi:hypothetical protein
MTETKIRSITKTIFWRLVATLNSYIILVLYTDPSYSNFQKAMFMNITGFFVYYIYERIWTSIKWGKK